MKTRSLHVHRELAGGFGLQRKFSFRTGSGAYHDFFMVNELNVCLGDSLTLGIDYRPCRKLSCAKARQGATRNREKYVSFMPQSVRDRNRGKGTSTTA